MKNPYYFKAYDENMRRDKAPNYISPNKRKEMKDYLSQVSIW